MAAQKLIELQGVGKDYPLTHLRRGRLATLKALLTGQGDFAHYRALHEVSFEVRAGESLGLVGENGAGKSTLLKVVAGVVKPTRGVVQQQGRVGALLELGAGFHPDYTGRENIFLASALMGISRPQIQERLEQIMAFAELGSHIDQPIKHYSSGMVVRLGFAVATSMRPDILITDEVLAVGDESFQRKCIRWMEDYLGDGGTLLLCSHSMFHIQKLCQRALWIDQGQVRMGGSADDVTREYLAYHEAKSAPAQQEGPRHAAVTGGVYAVKTLSLFNGAGQEVRELGMAQDLRVEVTLFSPDDRPPGVTIGIVRTDGTPVYGVVNDMDQAQAERLGPQSYRFVLQFSGLPLLPGRYEVRAHAMDPECLRLFDTWVQVFTVTGSSRELGFCRLQHQWG